MRSLAFWLGNLGLAKMDGVNMKFIEWKSQLIILGNCTMCSYTISVIKNCYALNSFMSFSFGYFNEQVKVIKWAIFQFTEYPHFPPQIPKILPDATLMLETRQAEFHQCFMHVNLHHSFFKLFSFSIIVSQYQYHLAMRFSYTLTCCLFYSSVVRLR